MKDKGHFVMALSWIRAVGICCGLELVQETVFVEDFSSDQCDFTLGAEFPGAQGAKGLSTEEFVSAPSSMCVQYDFSKGGNYTGVGRDVEIPETVTTIRFQAKDASGNRLVVRLLDSTGQTHQRRGVLLQNPGEWNDLTVRVSDQAFPDHWGGARDGILHFPLKELWICIAPGAERAKPGRLYVDDLRFGIGPCLARTSLDVDIGRVIGPATHKASGLLHSIRTDEPADERVRPLQIRGYRGNRRYKKDLLNPVFYNRIRGLGAKHVQFVLSDCRLKGWKDENGQLDVQLITEQFGGLIEEALARGMEFEWDIWNEPDGYFRGDFAPYFGLYKRVFSKIRELDSDAVITGPCAAWFNKPFLGAFLDYAHANNCMPDIITWHELGHAQFGGLHIPEHVKWLKDYMRANGMQVAERISLNEIRHHANHTSPGATVSHFAGIERCREVESAANSCWTDPGAEAAGLQINNGDNASLDGLLTHDTKQPRAAWWAYKHYADITGSIVTVTRPDRDTPMDGVAGYDLSGEEPVVRMLCGWFMPGVDAELTLNIRNLDQIQGVAGDGKLHVKVTRIPYTDYRECGEGDLGVMLDQEMEITGGTLVIELNEANVLSPHEACVVELTGLPSQGNQAN